MAAPFRVIDTGSREGRANIAYDAALIEARQTGLIPDTIRFLAFPPTALVGRHQAISRELKLEHCRARGIGLARRITGGGAIFFDERQLGWELVFAKHTLGLSTLAEITQAICTAAAFGLQRLGVAAAFRPRNDIEVAGRKLCGTGGFFDADVVFFQGTLLIDSDPEDVIAALNVPAPKLAKRALDSAAQRIVTLKALLGARLPPVERIKMALVAGFADRLGLDPTWGTPTPAEEALARRCYDEEIGTDAFVFEIDDPAADGGLLTGTRIAPGGTVTAYVRLEGSGTLRVREALITGDFFAAPPRIVLDLEAALRGTPVRAIGSTVERFFAARSAEVLSITPADFRAALEQAAAAALSA